LMRLPAPYPDWLIELLRSSTKTCFSLALELLVNNLN
jgi:hypothetical protein